MQPTILLEMVNRLGGLILQIWNSTQWLLPALLAAVAAAVLWIDGPIFWRWLRWGEPVSARQWLADNFWILVGSGLAVYLACHYPRDLW